MATTDEQVGADKAWMAKTCADAAIDKDAAHNIRTQLGKNGKGAAQAVLAKASSLWEPGTTLRFCFWGSKPGTTVQQNKVKSVMKIWEKYANIKFEYNTTEPVLRISFDPSLGSWCYVGKENQDVGSNSATTNFGWVSANSSTISNTDRGVILHELGHALGLMHEHQSPVRGGTITLKRQAVIDYYTETQNWDEDQVQSQILDVYNKKDVSNFSQLDIDSIMMYFMPEEMNIEGIEVDPNYDLSDLDKAFVVINYPSFEPREGADALWTFDYALNKAGVDATTKETLKAHFKKQEWDDIRFHFTNWCSSVQSKNDPGTPQTETPGQPQHGEAPVVDFCCSEDDKILGANKLLAAIHDRNIVLWYPYDKITYGFVHPIDKEDYRFKLIDRAFAYYGAAIGQSLVFSYITSGTPNVLITFANAGGSEIYSHAGRTAINALPLASVASKFKLDSQAAKATLVFGHQVFSNDKTKENAMTRTVFHAVGHVLGLHHASATPSTTTGASVSDTVATVADSASIMLYPTIVQPDAWERADDPLSAKDKALLRVLYPAVNQDTEYEKALIDLGVSNAGPSSGASHVKSIIQQKALAQASFSNDKLTFIDQIDIMRAMISKAVHPATGPQHSIGGPQSGTTTPTTNDDAKPRAPETKGSFLTAILAQLNDIFQPAGNQMFTLQFPGRFLSIDQYAWDTTSAGIYGQFIKPTVVNESEFRLVDSLYDVGSVVGGPNGINLSLVYEQCLNNLIPAFQSSPFNKQQDQIRKWLLRDVKAATWIQELVKNQHSAPTPSHAVTPGGSGSSSSSNSASSAPMFSVSNKLSEDKTINRLELSEILMQEYLTAKGAWQAERDRLILGAKTADELEAVTRSIAHLTPIREAQLAAKYADAVVRGYSHTIRQYMGYMDIKSPAEFLQDAKDALRESGTSSLDGAMKIYPVQLQPIDWFVGCSTSFTMEDLTQDPFLMQQQVNAKSQQLDVLNRRLASISLNTQPDMADIQAKLDAAESAYDSAQASLSNSYSSNVIQLAQTCLDQTGAFVLTDFVAVAQSFKISEDLFKDIDKGMKKVTDTQAAVTTTSRAYSRLVAQKALAQATDTDKEKAQINIEIAALTKELSELTARCAALRTKEIPAAPNSIDDVPIIAPVSGTSGGSRWQEIIMRHEVQSKYSKESSSSRSKVSSTDCNLFFGSYHRSSTEGGADASSLTIDTTNTVEIGLRATLVTVDRGGWFQPQFFKQSAGFYHLNDKISWSKWPEDIKRMSELKAAGDPAFETLNKSLLPAYPVGFIIAKDITIKIDLRKAGAMSEASNIEASLASSGGVLCFSTSSLESMSSSSKSYSSTMTSDGLIIRIPGPQILGYMLELTDNDETEGVPSTLPPDFLIGDADYDEVTTGNPTV